MPIPPLTFRRDLGGPLTAEQWDGNFDNLDARIQEIVDYPPVAISITDIASDGTNLIVTLSDLSTFSVAIPTRHYTPRTWVAGEALAVDDVFPINGTLYAVLRAHTPVDPFDAGANDGLGHNYYFALLPNPGNSLPDAGSTGQVLQKLSGADYDKGWRFLSAIYVAFDPSSDSSLTSDSVAEALEELEALIHSVLTGEIDALDADAIGFSPDSESGLVSSTVGGAINELASRATAFADLSGTIGAGQRDATCGSIDLDPTLGDVFAIAPTGNATLNALSGPVNAKITLIVTTTSVSSYNLTLGTRFKSQGVLATGTTAGKTFAISFVGDGTNLIEVSRTTAM
jgi:hypothetical protein